MKKIITYFLTVLIIVSSIYAQDEEKQKLIQDFKNKYPGKIFVKWDKISGGPSKIIGNEIFLESDLITEKNIQKLTQNFINENKDLLNINNTELKFDRTTKLNNKFIVSYQQLYKNIPLWNVKLKLKVGVNGKILMIKSPCFTNPNLTIMPKITVEEAKSNAITNFSNIDAHDVQGNDLVIYPERETSELYLCWYLRIESTEINKGIMIDAHTGQKIFEYDLHMNENIKGTVKTKTWSLPGAEGGTPNITYNCQDLKVNITGVGSANTNSSGYYSITVPSSGTYTITSSLDGPYNWVTNFGGSDASYTNTASTSSNHNWTWQESAHYNEYFVFHYMNNVWHEFNNKVSGFSSNYWYSNKMEGWANEDFDPGNSNGYANGTRISMTPLNHYGGSVYHEYTHNVIYRANGFWLGQTGDGGAMNEGFPDYYSCSFRNDPIRYASNRRLDTKMKYPGTGSIHTRGQIIGGACWDLAHKTGMSLIQVNGLVYEAITNMNYDETFGDFMDEILSADDNDGNIFNGTPHDDQIFDAFINDHAIVGSFLKGIIKENIYLVNGAVLIGDVTVDNGKTVTINSYENLNINNNYIRCIGSAKITKNGSVTNYSHYAKSGNDYKGFFPSSTSIQQIINWASSGWDIYVGAGTFTGNLAMKANVDLNGYPNLPIINGTITLNNDDNVRIENLKVKNKILITNSDNVYLNIRSDHPNCYVESVNSDIYFYDPYFLQSQSKAFYGHDNGHSEFFKGSFRNKTSQGAYLHYWATAEFTESIFCSNVFDINATGMCYAAINNYGYFSGSQYRSTVTSSVSVTPYQWYYCGSSALAKSTEEPTEADDVNEVGSAHTEFETAMNEYRIIKSYIRKDLKTDSEINPSKYKLDYENTIDAFKEVVEKYPTSTEAILSLDKISSSYRALGEYDNLMNYNNSISNNKNYYVLRPHALNIEKQTLIKQGEYTKALELSDQIIKEYPSHELIVELIYSKGLIYNYYLNDIDKAAEMFKEVIAKYPKEMTALSAKEELENLGIEFENNEQILTEETNIFNVESYPNPFNPSTTISYSLPSDANVKVVIYDIMGRVVKTLASDTQPSSNHHVIWDGTNLSGARVSSGIYLYRFEATSLIDGKHFTKTAKLMLVK